jgi:hypothetical protein
MKGSGEIPRWILASTCTYTFTCTYTRTSGGQLM